MTLAIPPHPGTPIFDELDEHFATIPVDGTPAPAPEVDRSQAPADEVVSVDDTNDSEELDERFASIPVDGTPALDTTPEDTTRSVRQSRAAWLPWLILAVGVTIGVIIWLSAPPAVVVI